jgi:hypothetical protein
MSDGVWLLAGMVSAIGLVFVAVYFVAKHTWKKLHE